MAETTTPADEMRALSALLHEKVADFRREEHEPYWSGGFTQGIDNACGGAGGLLAGMFSPEVAEALAGWLYRTARQWDHEVREAGHRRLHGTCDGAVGEDCYCFVGALEVTRALKAGVS
ncbi:hypothetical protein ABGB18_11170 [Nonomuraea sp. B12E4]|uniref:hypothetical protein n=1 Tax=Nonomuraea sp. B12E4 TaxID=3153564 RepID=UPI00325D6CEE